MLHGEDIVELAYGCRSGSEVFPALLRCLNSAFDCAVASIHVPAAYPVTGGGPLASIGFEPALVQSARARWPSYLTELAPLGPAAAQRDGVISDRDVFSDGARRRKQYFREFVAPQGDLDSLVGYVCLRGQPLAALMLGRGDHSWSRAARSELAQLFPALSLVVAAAPFTQRFWPEGARLSARERDVLGWVEAGLNNREIAQCCGSSVNTVRNQIASLLAKLCLDSRAELAASGLAAFSVRHEAR